MFKNIQIITMDELTNERKNYNIRLHIMKSNMIPPILKDQLMHDFFRYGTLTQRNAQVLVNFLKDF